MGTNQHAWISSGAKGVAWDWMLRVLSQMDIGELVNMGAPPPHDTRFNTWARILGNGIFADNDGLK